MLFFPDTELALMSAAALVNTMPQSAPAKQRSDQLTTTEQLDEFCRAWRWTGTRAATTSRNKELTDVQALRPRLLSLWLSPEVDAVSFINALLRDGHALPQLIKHAQPGYQIHATSPEAALAKRMAVESAMAMAHLVRCGALDRLKVCQATDCADVIVDLSKNQSRRFCDGWMREPGQRRRLPGTEGPARSRRRGHPPRPRRPARHRAAKRVLAVLA